MRKIIGAVGAAALMGTVSLAYATSFATGDIKSLDRSQHMLTLDNGSKFIAPQTAKLSNFKVGERVKVAYAMRGWGLGAQHATSITRAQQPVASDADLGG
jgi:Protein of unknown function (DUF1344)